MKTNKIIILLVFGLALTTGQASAMKMDVIPSREIIYPGQTFDLYVSIDPQGFEIAGGQLNFAFDNSLIKVNEIVKGPLFNQTRLGMYFHKGIINNSLGEVSNVFGVVLGPYNVSNSGVFIVINATAIRSISSTLITFSNVKFNDPEGNIVPVNVINGSVTIHLKGDLNNNGISADAGDQVLMKRASIGEIQPDSRYDLNNNGKLADAGDLVLMKRASTGDIIL